jgi:hypothetical protein
MKREDARTGRARKHNFNVTTNFATMAPCLVSSAPLGLARIYLAVVDLYFHDVSTPTIRSPHDPTTHGAIASAPNDEF